jgi:hypothetical protein
MDNYIQIMLLILFLVSNVSVNAHPTQLPSHHPSNLTSSVASNIRRLGWVPEPNQNRGTADIMYMCLATILICAWTVQHVDIPSSESACQHGHSRFDFKLHKLRWTLLTLLAPETTSFMSARDFMEARSLGKLVRRYQIETWGPTESAYAVMGGLRYCDGEDTLLLNSSAAMQKFLDRGGATSLQQVSEKDIKDRDKGSWIVNTIACLQVVWFVVQLICRQMQGLPSSILEITTLGFVVFSLVSFGLWWRKPQDVECYVILESPARPQNQHVVEDCKTGESATAQSSGQFLTRVVMICAFGSLHFLAWGTNFPTPVEQDLWKIACTMMVLLPLCLWCLMRTGIKDEYYWVRQGRTVLSYAGAFAYALCRLFVIVEPFLQLRDMPAGVFQSVQLPWSKYFPHID